MTEKVADGRDQADDQAGDHGEGVPGPAQQLPRDVFQVHVLSASIDAFVEGRKAFHTNARRPERLTRSS